MKKCIIWIYSQIFKEILLEIKEDERLKVKEYCKDIYTNENTYHYITTRRDLIEEFDSLRVMILNLNPYVSIGNLMVEKKDYQRAEQFYSQALSLKTDNTGQIKLKY